MPISGRINSELLSDLGVDEVVKALKWVSYLTIGIAFIAGIVAGRTLGAEPEYSFEDKKFAWGYMLMLWAAGGVSAVFTLAFAALLEHVEYVSERLHDIQNTLQKNKDIA